METLLIVLVIGCALAFVVQVGRGIWAAGAHGGASPAGTGHAGRLDAASRRDRRHSWRAR